MSAQLKPCACPFCGADARHLPAKSGFWTERVICDACEFCLEATHHEGAIDRWNRRATPAPGAPGQEAAVSWQVRRTDDSPLACWETCTKDLYDLTLSTGRYCGFENGPPCEVRALGVIAAQEAAAEVAEGERSIIETYDKLHEGKVGAHWLWCVIEQIAAGVSEVEAMRGFGYYEAGPSRKRFDAAQKAEAVQAVGAWQPSTWQEQEARYEQEMSEVYAIEKALAMFPIQLDAQAFTIAGHGRVTADGDDTFYSKKKVLAVLEELRGYLLDALPAGAGPEREWLKCDACGKDMRGHDRMGHCGASAEERTS